MAPRVDLTKVITRIASESEALALPKGVCVGDTWGGRTFSDNIAAILKAFPKAKFKIGGYTDKTGDEPGNMKLSNDRAKAVKDALNKVNSPNGALGLLLNDKKLYTNLESTTRSLNILLDDLRMHPKRYVNISVFGSKDKKGPLMAPLNDTSANSNPPTKK